MEGVPAEAIEEKMIHKLSSKRMKIEKELTKMGINVDDPNFDLKDYEVPVPNPPKKKQENVPPFMMHGMPPPGFMPPMMHPPPMAPVKEEEGKKEEA